MTAFSMSITSKCVGGETHVTVILPIGNVYEDGLQAGEKFQTVWLLHGGGGNSTEWFRMTDIERHAINHKLAVVMPEIGSNFYNDIPNGPQYFTYITEELPNLLRKHFPLSDKREDNFICGLSMGGFGASKAAFNLPEKYAAVGLMSTGPINPIQLRALLAKRSGGPYKQEDNVWYNKIFGGIDKIPGSINDTWYVLKKAKEEGKDLPKMYVCCGTEDFLFPAYTAFKKFAEENGIEATFETGHGAHSWDFWHEFLGRWIDWLPLKDRDFCVNWNRSVHSICAPADNSEPIDDDWTKY